MKGNLQTINVLMPRCNIIHSSLFSVISYTDTVCGKIPNFMSEVFINRSPYHRFHFLAFSELKQRQSHSFERVSDWMTSEFAFAASS